MERNNGAKVTEQLLVLHDKQLVPLRAKTHSFAIALDAARASVQAGNGKETILVLEERLSDLRVAMEKMAAAFQEIKGV